MLAVVSAILFAQVVAVPPVPSIKPVRTEKRPDIDGDLSDAVWAKAATSSDFTQKFPNEGGAPSERTRRSRSSTTTKRSISRSMSSRKPWRVIARWRDVSGLPSRGPNPSLMLGIAGIGYTFLRMHDLKTPSVLLPLLNG